MNFDRYTPQEVHALARRLKVGFERPKEAPKPKTQGVGLPRPPAERTT